MTFNDKEIALAKRLHELLKAKGELPEIQIGDWVICYPSSPWLTCHEVEMAERNQDRNNYILLWSWERCREWLREKGWKLNGHNDHPDNVTLSFYNDKSLKDEYGEGQADAEAAMAVMVQVAEKKG